MRIYVIGSLNMDLVIKTPIYPKLGQTVVGSNFMINPGGKGANQAVASARFGAQTLMVGAVGNQFGLELIDTLKAYGVDTTHVKMVDDVSSGISVITIAESDNSIILDEGSNAFVSKEDVDKALKEAKPNDFLLVQLEIPVAVVMYALKVAKEKGLRTLLNPAPAKALDASFYAFIDYMVLNQSETEFYTNVYPKTNEDAVKAAQLLHKQGIRHIIITMGSKGSLHIEKEITQVDAYKVKIIDTTAAGDTYIGVLTAMLLKKSDIKKAMSYASAAAALTITKKGAQQSIPSHKEVLEMVGDQVL